MDDVAALLGAWMMRQRWYATKGRTPRIRIIGTARLGDATDGARSFIHLVVDEAPEVPVLYQVPVVGRAMLVPDSPALICEAGGEYLYDGPHDPAFTAALLDAISGERAIAGDDVSMVGTAFGASGRVVGSRVLGGEQSNTSIVYDLEGGPLPFVIAKVFRVLHHGENPDVTTQAALTQGGSHRAPPLVGYLTATWPDPGRDSGTATGQLAFAQEFLPGLDDGWRVALRAAVDAESFADRAYDLGIATAEVHATLARVLPATAAGPDDIADALVSMGARLSVATKEVPGVAALAESISAVYSAAAEGDLPPLQRIHGDLHLGQALLSPERGWMLIDFEGEPLRPMDERSRPDSTLRDIAGMLRSFDYVAGALANTDGTDARDWASEARRSYVDGYIASSGFDVRGHRLLLDAFELDKAVYEAVYESRSRPTWVGIPLAAIERLIARSAPMPG
ncbi:phosphotransferase [Diaminobutyricibacter tongyongensis]|uniref:Maltokinase n=1 Tax=Leifsonia tongyongensis TaxID=1268043 RepID=A0A6L9XZ82_9MICO|nr:phosphotransferase [Diaminobutyricibacter tongyongensis]NEN06616.1 phosphotransferase [Diaminobutyricibacter tongyongensis]